MQHFFISLMIYSYFCIMKYTNIMKKPYIKPDVKILRTNFSSSILDDDNSGDVKIGFVTSSSNSSITPMGKKDEFYDDSAEPMWGDYD